MLLQVARKGWLSFGRPATLDRSRSSCALLHMDVEQLPLILQEPL